MTEINATQATINSFNLNLGQQFGEITSEQRATLTGLSDSLSKLYADGKIVGSEVAALADLQKKFDSLAGGMKSGVFGINSTRENVENISASINNDLRAFSQAMLAEAKAKEAELAQTGKVDKSDILASMDIATALMFVQSERVARLEEQIKDQLTTVSKRNEQIGKLNGVLTELNGLVGKIGGTDATSTLPASAADIQKATDVAAKAGFTISPAITSTTTRGDLEKLVSKVKNEIDGLSNTQQMDMLRLQSLNNKRNEAFEVMTNVMKKVSDLLSNIASKI
jgi:hypothetical protein